LTEQGDFAEKMVDGMNAYLLRETIEMREHRVDHWHRDFSSPAHYVESVEPNRVRFRAMIGAVDQREKPDLELVAPFNTADVHAGLVGIASDYKIYAVRWHVLRGVDGEGLLLIPNRPNPIADIVALPDCDWTPEMLAGLTPGVSRSAQFARRLAENGCRVIVPMLLNRQDTHSGMGGKAMTNETHREFIYRAAYEMGRHIIGYEVQKTLAAIDWLIESRSDASRAGPRTPVAVMGYGEGGLIAFYSAACDTRIDAAAVCGYYQPRESLWQEPIYRNVFGLLAEFGDAEIASLVAPRVVIVEACSAPEVPAPPQTGRGGAAPGRLTTPAFKDVQAEVQRARELTHGLAVPPILKLIGGGTGDPGSDACLSGLLTALSIKHGLITPGKAPVSIGKQADPADQLKRQFQQLAEHTQVLMLESPDRRREYWSQADFSSVAKLEATTASYRERFKADVLGELPPPSLPASPQTRQVYDTPSFTGYEVKLDLYPDVFAYGILLIPKGIKL
jgi:hypothetical protein